MLIAILSDCHDAWHNLEKAMRVAAERGCEVILNAGDLVSPLMLPYCASFPGHVHHVLGNNEGELIAFTRTVDASQNMTLHGNLNGGTMEMEFGGLRFYMNHYPKNAELAALSGHYDVCVFGHTHEYYDDTTGNGTRLLNPGEIQGFRTGTAGMMIFDTTTKKAERIIL